MDLGRMWVKGCSLREGWSPGFNSPGAERLGTPNLLIRSVLTPWPIATQHPARVEDIICTLEGIQSLLVSQEISVEEIAFLEFELSEINTYTNVYRY